MSCYHPLKAFHIGYNTETNKKILKIVPYKINHIEFYREKSKYMPIESDFVSSYADKVFKEFDEIPCGRCIGCRLDYSRQWANRMMCELKYHKSAYFVTLTYDDNHVPVSYYPDKETGEAIPSMTLCKADFQKFMKRLRKHTGQELRFYACGEYGSTTFRPHYHAIIFGLELDDLKVYKQSREFTYYNSKTVQDAWSIWNQDKHEFNPIGYAVVAPVTWETCAYVSRYVTKKLNGKASDFYKTFNIIPEFSLMSRKPGIGREYYEDNKNHIYEYDKIVIGTADGSKSFKPPKYFDSLYEVDYPEESERIRGLRKSTAKAIQEMKLNATSLDYEELLEVEERNKKNQIKSLQRPL